jgi:hypothetical protein
MIAVEAIRKSVSAPVASAKPDIGYFAEISLPESRLTQPLTPFSIDCWDNETRFHLLSSPQSGNAAWPYSERYGTARRRDQDSIRKVGCVQALEVHREQVTAQEEHLRADVTGNA